MTTRLQHFAVLALLTSARLGAEDFRLSYLNLTPVSLHTTLTYEGKGTRVIATARNDSDAVIQHARICVLVFSFPKECLVELWNTQPWSPGTDVRWNVLSSRKVPLLSHTASIEEFETSNLPEVTSPGGVATVAATKSATKNTSEVSTGEAARLPNVAAAENSTVPRNRDEEVFSNDTILKLAKAGLNDAIIVGMIGSHPGKYSLDSDSVIGMKVVGISDAVIAALVTKRPDSSTPHNGITVPRSASTEPFVLHDGTPVRLRLARNLSSADAKTGETIDFEVLDDVRVDDIIVVKRGSTAIGTVTDAERKKRMARGGKLDVTIDYVRLTDGDKVALRGVRETSGGGHTGGMTAGIVVTALVVWPAAPFFLFMQGKDTVIPKDTEIAAYVNGEIRLDRTRFGR